MPEGRPVTNSSLCMPNAGSPSGAQPRGIGTPESAGLLRFKLVENSCRVVSERSFKFWVLAEIGVSLHVDLTPQLVERSSFLGQCPHLLKQVTEIVAEAREVGFCPQVEMA